MRQDSPAPTPKPSSVSLPLTFANSFWSTDYRTGFSTAYSSLSYGINSSSELLGLILRRAASERSYADSLLPPDSIRDDGFNQMEGSLRLGYESLVSVGVSEAKARMRLAEELERGIGWPFKKWSEAHKGRVESSRSLVEGNLIAYEQSLSGVRKAKTAYDEACRQADAAEDELAFSGGLSATERSPLSPSATPLSPSRAEKGKAKEGAPLSINTGSDSPDPAPSDAEDEDGLIGRSGATGGSLVGALGRAFTVKRKQLQQATANAASPISPSSADGPVKLLQDPRVEEAVEWSKSRFNDLLSRVAGPQTGQARHDRARLAAEAAEDKYKHAVALVENHRLVLEEALAEHLAYGHRCESDRLQAAASVMKSYEAALAALPGAIEYAHKRTQDTLALLRPERDVRGVVERLKTGPFQPQPVAFHSHYSEPSPTSFGVDLRKFQETDPRGSATGRAPPVLTFLLDYLAKAYEGVEDDGEKRRAHLYEVPLAAQHHLRAVLNNNGPYDPEEVKRFDLPVVAATLKLWLLELEQPVILFSQYDEYRALYPSRVGAESVSLPAKLLASHLARLPPIHLSVLRLVINHFATLINDTKTDEADEVYLQKLSLSFGRCLVRPRVETALTLDDRFPVLLFADLVRGAEEVFKAADELRDSGKREDRYMPRRQRTKPVDVRLSRSSLRAAGAGAGAGVPGVPDQAEAMAVLREHRESLSSNSTTPEGSSGGGSGSSVPRVLEPIRTGQEEEGALPVVAEGQVLSASPVEAAHPQAAEEASVASPAEDGEHEGVETAAAKLEGKATAVQVEGATEEAFVPPASSPQEERRPATPEDEPFVPPGSTEAEQTAPAVPVAVEGLGAAADKREEGQGQGPGEDGEVLGELQARSSLKRSAGATRGGRGARPVSGRIAAARASFEQEGR